MENLSLSTTSPVSESCLQLGSGSYHEFINLETSAFINQLRRAFGQEPPGCQFKVTKNPHDFGTYSDVEIVFDEDDEDASDYAYDVESELPEYWDDEAKEELIRGGYPVAFTEKIN
jgi:hypothetical protein